MLCSSLGATITCRGSASALSGFTAWIRNIHDMCALMQLLGEFKNVCFVSCNLSYLYYTCEEIIEFDTIRYKFIISKLCIR